MAYTKVTADDLIRSIKEGKYSSATGARRAVGKTANLSDNDKNRVRREIDVRFGKPVVDKRVYSGARPEKVVEVVVKFLSYDHPTRVAILDFIGLLAPTGMSAKTLQKVLTNAQLELRRKHERRGER
jgi:hypothetical protein